MFVAGVVHGKDKQASLYRLAKGNQQKEEELVEKYVKEMIEEDEKKAATGMYHDDNIKFIY